MEVLITGLNTYLGKGAARFLNSEKFNVTGLVRDLSLLNKGLTAPITAKLYQLDLLRYEGVDNNFLAKNIQLGFYFTQIRTLNNPLNMQMELISLRNFIQVCLQHLCSRIVYVATLLDLSCLQTIKKLFDEFQIEYTIVLKTNAIGQGTTLMDLFSNLAKVKNIPYWPNIADHMFKPIDLLDVYRWIRTVPWENHFINEVIYLVGDRSLSCKQLFFMYMKVNHPYRKVRVYPVKKWLAKFLYTNFYDLYEESFEELKSVLLFESDLNNNSWMNVVPFAFTPIDKSILIDQEKS